MTDTPSEPAISWLDRLKAWFSKKPQNKETLIAQLREMQSKQTLSVDALRMIEGVLQISDMRVADIMLPRAEMIAVSKDATLQDMLPTVIKSGHSRFPVIGENKDEVIGILLAKDLLYYAQPQFTDDFSMKDLLRPAYFVPENKPLNLLLNEFRKNRIHLAIIVDEYGCVSGLVSIEDVLEQIVGSIEDEHDITDDIYIKAHQKNRYSVKAVTPITDFNDFFKTGFSDEQFDTIGGLVLQGFGHMPKRGEMLTIDGIQFKVLRANNRRIQVLQVVVPLSEIE